MEYEGVSIYYVALLAPIIAYCRHHNRMSLEVLALIIANQSWYAVVRTPAQCPICGNFEMSDEELALIITICNNPAFGGSGRLLSLPVTIVMVAYGQKDQRVCRYIGSYHRLL